MEAKVKYGDLTGTAAADTFTDATLTSYLKTLHINTDRYEAIGIEFYSSLRSFKASIICIDKIKTEDNKTRTVKVLMSKDMKLEDFFVLFSQFHIVLTDKVYTKEMLNEYDTIELSSSEY